MTTGQVPLVLQAIDALKRGDRRAGAALLQQDLREGSPSPDRCRTISRLAAEIGEIDVALDAARLAANPTTLERLLNYWGTLASYGRADEALRELSRLPVDVRKHHAVLHFEGTIASEAGRFQEAEHLLRRALAAAPHSSQSWFALAMIKTFTAGDPDIAAIESLTTEPDGGQLEAHSRLFYALGKAWDDCGEFDRAFENYKRGAGLRRQSGPYDAAEAGRAADRVIREFTPEAMSRLKPSGMGAQRSLFVTGLPRSGTTLVQQILGAHSEVAGGGDEANLFKPAALPTIDFTVDGAIAYQERSTSADPWGDIAKDYARFIDMRFRSPGLVVDKSMGQSALTGLLLHSLPRSRIVWLRRRPEDTALSCFKTFFTAATRWSWSIEDIAAHFRIENRLLAHWLNTFPDRILVVPYEELAANPGQWIGQICGHFGLEVEAGMERFNELKRPVRTASLTQVRSPLSTGRIGTAESYPEFTNRFLAAYCG